MVSGDPLGMPPFQESEREGMASHHPIGRLVLSCDSQRYQCLTFRRPPEIFHVSPKPRRRGIGRCEPDPPLPRLHEDQGANDRLH